MASYILNNFFLFPLMNSLVVNLIVNTSSHLTLTVLDETTPMLLFHEYIRYFINHTFESIDGWCEIFLTLILKTISFFGYNFLSLLYFNLMLFYIIRNLLFGARCESRRSYWWLIDSRLSSLIRNKFIFLQKINLLHIKFWDVWEAC